MKVSKKQLISVFKLIVSFGLIYFILKKIDFNQVIIQLANANYFYLTIALIFFITSKIIASFRLNLYFRNLPIFISQVSNLKLYLLGMFYNLFLPGGIGGDAYKVWLLNKEFQIKTKKLVSSVFVDRLSGLLQLYILAVVIALFINNEAIEKFRLLLLISIPTAILVFWLLHKYLFINEAKVLWKSLVYSLFVQISQVICVVFILKALDIQSNTFIYLFIFLISSIVSIIPITIGGIGLREATFFYASSFFLLDADVAISVSMLFFLIQAFVSFFGIIYHLKSSVLKSEIKSNSF